MEESNEELKLAEQLRDSCDASGREIDLGKSAQLIHQLGLEYKKRSPDKISLIQCVGLLNAALFRKPVNVLEVRSDLSEACQHILSLSKAAKPNVDLIGKAEEAKVLLDQLRDEVCEMLKSPQAVKIPTDVESQQLIKLQENKTFIIKFINESVANKYTNIMAGLSEYCESVMGKPPCKYCVAGMGSLARKEITPYSDFEHILLLEDLETDLELDAEFFRWHSVIFHVIILNLQETIIPSLNIESLNNTEVKGGDWFFDAYTPRGVSFDGMMPHACKFPMGRQKSTKNKPWRTELIKPVTEMLKYLSSEENLKNGYHLSDILTKTCFVFGNQELYQQFVDGVQKFRDQKSQNENMEDTKREVKEDLNQFSARFRISSLKSFNSINIKQVMYRSSTLFVSALGKINNIAANSCFDIIEEMAHKQVITSKTKHKLSYAVSVACEIRIRTYMSSKSQRDNVNLVTGEHGKSMEAFLSIVGPASTINYFQITYCLQCEVAKKLKFTNFHFYSNPALVNLAVYLALDTTELLLGKDLGDFMLSWNMDLFEFESCLKRLENQTSFVFSDSKKLAVNLVDENHIESLAKKLRDTNLQGDAAEFFQHLMYFYEKKPESRDAKKRMAQTATHIGDCLASLKYYDDALPHYQKSLQLYKAISVDEQKDRDVAATLNTIGYCLSNLYQQEKAITYYQDSLKIFQNALCGTQSEIESAWTLFNIGSSFFKLRRSSEALTFFKRSLQVYQKRSKNESKDHDIARTLSCIGHCLCNLNENEEALHFHEKSLQIIQNASADVKQDRDVARMLNTIGSCLSSLHRQDDAVLNYYERALEIYKNVSVDEAKDRDIARTFSRIASYFSNVHRYDDALNHYNKALHICLNCSLNEQKDHTVALTLEDIAYCLRRLHRYDDALGYSRRALQIYKNIAAIDQMDQDVARTHYCIGTSLSCLDQQVAALKHHNISLQIYQEISPNQKNDYFLARTLNAVGVCLFTLHRYNEALTHHNKALVIYQNISLNVKDSDMVTTQNYIENCHSSLKSLT